jgi:uncharacterized protein (TIGR02996 family)
MSMPEAARLLQAVIADPDNDTPRLAYADWLEAEGDADRAAFIRVQCMLERLPIEDPQHVVLRQRETELLSQYGYRWAEEFGDQISVWVYRRGFIERVEMCLETSAEQIRVVLDRAPIRHIRDVSQLDDLTGVVEVLPGLARLTGLEFWGLYAFDDRLLARMLGAPELANLHTLILHHDRNGNLAKESVLVEALMSPLRANLRELAVNVDGTWRGPSPRLVQAMARSPSLTHLRKLDLSNARLGVATVEAIGRSIALAGLVELDMAGCSLTEASWRAVLNLPQLPRLHWLRLHDARLVDQQRRHSGYLRDQPEYVDAFTARVAAVDWDTEFIDPYSGGTWIGLSWEARRRNRLFAMNCFIRNQNYDELEAEYRRECLLSGGTTIADEIGALPFAEYQRQLAANLDAALAHLDRADARSLFLRIRPDVYWRGEFHIQAEPRPDTWEPYEEYSYNSPTLQFPVPNFLAAAEIFTKYPLKGSIEPSGPAMYLIARTVAAFGRCLQARHLPVSVWFSCVWAVFRMG